MCFFNLKNQTLFTLERLRNTYI